MGAYLEKIRRLKQVEESPQKELTDCTTASNYEINEINEKSPLHTAVQTSVGLPSVSWRLRWAFPVVSKRLRACSIRLAEILR